MTSSRVWRIRWWARGLSVAILAIPIGGMLWPSWLNPTWTAGMPSDQWVWLSVVLGIELVIVWAAFRSRIELSDSDVRIVNPWGTRTLPRHEVTEVRPGPFGAEFCLGSGKCVSAFAVQCSAPLPGREARWVGLARAVVGEPRGTMLG